MQCCIKTCNPLSRPQGATPRVPVFLACMLKLYMGVYLPHVATHIAAFIVVEGEILEAVKRGASNQELDYFAGLEWHFHPHYYVVACRFYSCDARISKWVTKQGTSRMVKRILPPAVEPCWMTLRNLCSQGAPIDTLECLLSHCCIKHVPWYSLLGAGITSKHIHVMEWAYMYYINSPPALQYTWEIMMNRLWMYDHNSHEYKDVIEWLIKNTFTDRDSDGIDSRSLQRLARNRSTCWIFSLIVQYQLVGEHNLQDALTSLVKIDECVMDVIALLLVKFKEPTQDGSTCLVNNKKLLDAVCYAAYDSEESTAYTLIMLGDLTTELLGLKYYERVKELWVLPSEDEWADDHIAALKVGSAKPGLKRRRL